MNNSLKTAYESGAQAGKAGRARVPPAYYTARQRQRWFVGYTAGEANRSQEADVVHTQVARICTEVDAIHAKLEEIAACDMGWLTMPMARRFHSVVSRVEALHRDLAKTLTADKKPAAPSRKHRQHLDKCAARSGGKCDCRGHSDGQ